MDEDEALSGDVGVARAEGDESKLAQPEAMLLMVE